MRPDAAAGSFKDGGSADAGHSLDAMHQHEAGKDSDASSDADDAATGAHHVIELHTYRFTPPEKPLEYQINLTTTIAKGDTVDWVWTVDFAPEVGQKCNVISPAMSYTGTNMADCVNIANPDPVVDSGQQAYPFTYSHRFTQSGSYPYVCQNHCIDNGSMWGVIVVE